jgi:hypothetical protein
MNLSWFKITRKNIKFRMAMMKLINVLDILLIKFFRNYLKQTMDFTD